MSTIRNAKKILYDLKRAGYEGYIVGGAVRDHLLKIPINDIDITTNAKPFQVTKMFKTKPTGLKYGTVTVFMQDETFEVTTFRLDGEYIDGRHPDEVIYAETVEEDVKRRDFTINGMLMTEKDEIIDHVGGRRDLQNKLIRTIGDPADRFNEDALRIMRAFYFQAKLGFQIDRETRDAILLLKDNLKMIAMERILEEFIKMMKGKYVRRAIQSMITTGVHEVLPGLSKGLMFVKDLEEMPFVDTFFTLAFTLNGTIPKEWPFSNKHRHRYEIASMLANTHLNDFDPHTLYTYGFELCVLANKVNFILGRAKNLKTKIESDYENLPLQSDLDLKLRATEMIAITGKKAGAWVKQLQTEMVIEVLNKRLNNDKDELISYVKSYQIN